MAIELEQKKKTSWGNIIFVILVFIILGSGAYYLYFAPKPAIEILVPTDQKITTELSKINFDPSSVIDSEAFRLLRKYSGPVNAGSLGRSNPFVKF